MKNILVTRIDDRLIHGQIVTSWIKAYPINHILIVAEDLAKNQLMQRIYKSVAPSGVTVTILDNKASADLLKQEPNKDENYLILVKTPDVLEFLFDQGIPISKIVLGGMGAKPGRDTLIRNVSVNETELDCFRRLIDHGIQIVYQLVPVEKEIDIKNAIERKQK